MTCKRCVDLETGDRCAWDDQGKWVDTEHSWTTPRNGRCGTIQALRDLAYDNGPGCFTSTGDSALLVAVPEDVGHEQPLGWFLVLQFEKGSNVDVHSLSRAEISRITLAEAEAVIDYYEPRP